MSTLFSQNLSKNNVIRPQEAIFTEKLSSIAVVPKMLYFYGKMPENVPKVGTRGGVGGRESRAVGNDLSRRDYGNSGGKVEPLKVVAIVGTRRSTSYGEKIAYELAYAAAKQGAVVVSGLAYGIDSIAHRGALDAGGITVAVLGTPIDRVYPRAHEGLAAEIVEKGGAVMSEIGPGEDFWPRTSFLGRNRLISGVADVVVVVEAALRSGALNTAAHALEQGREVFAVPGDITRKNSEGCNRLIAKGGAQVYTGVDDVLGWLFPVVPKLLKQEKLLGDNSAETAVLGAIRAGCSEGERILTETGLAASELYRTLTMLEVKGRIKALGMNKWAILG